MQVMWYNLVHVFVLVTSTEADNDTQAENPANSDVHILNVTSSIGDHHTTTPMWLHGL